MSKTRTLILFAASIAALAAAPSRAANVLFPKSLHLVRQIDDPLSQKTTTVDQYCAGNRIVTVSGPRVAIVDYDQQQVTEIDHAAGTYSITRFDELAKALGSANHIADKSTRTKWTEKPLGTKSSAGGRSVESFEMTREGAKRRVEIGVDRQIALSKEAVEALVGAAYPNTRNDDHEAVLAAAAPHGRAKTTSNATGAATAAPYGLPAEQVITYDAEGLTVTMKSSIVRVDGDAAPADALLIAPGTKRVVASVVRAAAELDALDHPGTATKKQ